MKKKILILLSLFSAGNLVAQPKQKLELYLSNYLFKQGINDVGSIKLNDGQVTLKSVTVSGSGVKLIHAGDSFKLTISNKTDASKPWIDVPVKAVTSAGPLADTFRIVNNTFVKNKVIAHRGAWKNTGATENSIAALQHAIGLGCEGSEFDVHMSADFVLYIHHDHEINGVSIEQSPSATLSGIKLTNGEQLPTLEAYLKEGMKQNKTRLILEIKASKISKERSIALTNRVVDVVKKLKAEGWVDYISFDYDVCKEVMRLAPYAKVSYLMGDKAPAALARERFFGLDYHFSVLQKQPDWIKEAKQNKLTVNVWTVNDEQTMDWLLKEDADFITTNEPELLLKKVSSK